VFDPPLDSDMREGFFELVESIVSDIYDVSIKFFIDRFRDELTSSLSEVQWTIGHVWWEDFFQGANCRFFQVVCKIIFPGWTTMVKFHFANTKEKHFSTKKWVKNIKFQKFIGVKTPSAPPSDTHATANHIFVNAREHLCVDLNNKKKRPNSFPKNLLVIFIQNGIHYMSLCNIPDLSLS